MEEFTFLEEISIYMVCILPLAIVFITGFMVTIEKDKELEKQKIEFTQSKNKKTEDDEDAIEGATKNIAALRKKEKIIPTIFTIAIISFYVFLMCFIGNIRKEANNSNYTNEYLTCMESTYKNGKDFTEDQCDFFRDVLHGKYEKE